jgi:hypothetical protein
MLKMIKIGAITYLHELVSSNIKVKIVNTVNLGLVSNTFGVAVLTSIGNNKNSLKNDGATNT